jgi:hypothetical protein
MRSIYKYDIVEAKDGIIEGPITKLLHVGAQHNSIKIWAEIDTNAPIRKFQILPIGTGWNLDTGRADKQCVLDTHTYMGTVMLANGNLVFHVYGTEIISASTKKPELPKENVVKAEKVINTNNSKNKEATFSGTITMINPDVLKQFLGC